MNYIKKLENTQKPKKNYARKTSQFFMDMAVDFFEMSKKYNVKNIADELGVSDKAIYWHASQKRKREGSK